MSELATVRLRERNQITIPSKISEEMKLEIGEELLIFESEGKITIIPKIKDPMKMAGMFGKDTTKNLKEEILKYRRGTEWKSI